MLAASRLHSNVNKVSIPIARATGYVCHFADVRQRFIPAWAGNSQAPPQRAVVQPVHPRVGGEQHCPPIRRARASGSSPRGRGTGVVATTPSVPARFIPAWAGNSDPWLMSRGRSAVHPRVGGEQALAGLVETQKDGSSPRGRGTDLDELPPAVAVRFIPAWAGNSRSAQGIQSVSAVHPRVGGEQIIAIPDMKPQDGSSPRGRGTAAPDRADGPGPRFIPAWAGNSWSVPSRPARRSVHPRVGGEQSFSARPMWRAGGSSPRGRGTDQPATTRQPAHRFIPAWAGNRYR